MTCVQVARPSGTHPKLEWKRKPTNEERNVHVTFEPLLARVILVIATGLCITRHGIYGQSPFSTYILMHCPKSSQNQNRRPPQHPWDYYQMPDYVHRTVNRGFVRHLHLRTVRHAQTGQAAECIQELLARQPLGEDPASWIRRRLTQLSGFQLSWKVVQNMVVSKYCVK